ncbi:MAG: hypothetical protein Tsb0015_05000 [Simkaniaceae bacterium]
MKSLSYELLVKKKQLLFFFVLFFSGKLFGLPLENIAAPHLPEKGFFFPENSFIGFKTGYFLDHARNQHFDLEESCNRSDFVKIGSFSYWMHGGSLTFNINDFVEIYGLFGKAKVSLTQKFSNLKTKYGSNFEWFGGGGGRATIIFWKNTTFGMDAKYFQSLPMKLSGDLKGQKNSAAEHLRSWQVGAGLSHRLGFFIPYIGGIYTKYHLKVGRSKQDLITISEKKLRFVNHRNFSLAGGFSFSSPKIFLMTVEGRIFGEEAITASFQVRF